MDLHLISRNRKRSKSVQKDHYWYDHVQKVMLHGYGGRMEFIYDHRQHRMIPVVVDHEERIEENDFDLIKKWVLDKQDKYNISVEENTGKNVTISVHVSHFDEIVRDLYNHNIIFDYDHKQIKTEMRDRYVSS